MIVLSLAIALILAGPRTSVAKTDVGTLVFRSFNGSVTSDEDRLGTPGFFHVESSDREVLLKVQFETGVVLPNAPRFRVYRLASLPHPLVFVVAPQIGGSDHSFETTIVGLVGGQPRELLTRHIFTTLQDAVCIAYRQDGSALLVTLKFLWEDEAHYEPHRYRLTEYRWTPDGFVEGKKLQTAQKHPSWSGAARELGYRLRHDFVRALTPDYRDP